MKKKDKQKKQFYTLEDIEAALGRRLKNPQSAEKQTEAPVSAEEEASPDAALPSAELSMREAGRKTEGARAVDSKSTRKRRASRAGSLRRERLSKAAGAAEPSKPGQLSEYGRLFVIPVFAVLLLLLILFLNGRNENAAPASDPAEAEQTATVSTAAETPVLKVCEIPEIRMLIDAYFSARLSADAEQLYTLFGKTADNQFDAVKARLETQRAWIQSFDDITVYELPGQSSDARVCIVTYSVDFRRTDTKAPGIMYCYVQKNAEGSYILTDQPRKEIRDFMQEELGTPEVEALRLEVDNSLKNALNADSTLALIYTAFVNGEIYDESELEAEEHQVDLFLNPEDSDLVGGVETAAAAAEADHDAEAGDGTTAAGDGTTAADGAQAQPSDSAAPEISIVTEETGETVTSAEAEAGADTAG